MSTAPTQPSNLAATTYTVDPDFFKDSSPVLPNHCFQDAKLTKEDARRTNPDYVEITLEDGTTQFIRRTSVAWKLRSVQDETGQEFKIASDRTYAVENKGGTLLKLGERYSKAEKKQIKREKVAERKKNQSK